MNEVFLRDGVYDGINLGHQKGVPMPPRTLSHSLNLSKALKNKPKSEEHKKAVSETKKRLYKEGKIKPSHSCFKKGMTAWNKGFKGIWKGEENGNWHGGISFEPYGLDFNREFKERVRDRDNHHCLGCNKREEELNRKLDVHHVDYNKRNNSIENAISLCKICHSGANSNRTFWKIVLQALLKGRYGYDYSEDNTLFLDFIQRPLLEMAV